MRKKILITGFILVLLLAAIGILWRAYNLSSDYNYATAKLDIKNDQVKRIHVGIQQLTGKENEIEMIAARYGFKNVYIEKLGPEQTARAIDNYNELADAYLNLRNGPGWKESYKKEIDSLFKPNNDPGN